MPTRLPSAVFGSYASRVTRIRSHELVPGTGRSGWSASVRATATRRTPRSVSSATSATGGPSVPCSKAAEISVRSTGPVKRTSSHSPTAPFQPSDRQPVRGSSSSAAYGCRPGSRWPTAAVTAESADEAVTSFTSR